jgi:hypothetical protein
MKHLTLHCIVSSLLLPSFAEKRNRTEHYKMRRQRFLKRGGNRRKTNVILTEYFHEGNGTSHFLIPLL